MSRTCTIILRTFEVHQFRDVPANFVVEIAHAVLGYKSIEPDGVRLVQSSVVGGEQNLDVEVDIDRKTANQDRPEWRILEALLNRGPNVIF